tara:strand:- start:3289 stop:3552 length:264 start_codon:yes stop_codon:yes gene_type:complete
MDFLMILEQYGVPIAVAIAFGFFIWKQNQFIQNDLSQDLKDKFERLEGIIIGLINAQKKHSIDLKGLTKSYQTIVDVITKIIKKENK